MPNKLPPPPIKAAHSFLVWQHYLHHLKENSEWLNKLKLPLPCLKIQIHMYAPNICV